jgi:hypothetical protein
MLTNKCPSILITCLDSLLHHNFLLHDYIYILKRNLSKTIIVKTKCKVPNPPYQILIILTRAIKMNVVLTTSFVLTRKTVFTHLLHGATFYCRLPKCHPSKYRLPKYHHHNVTITYDRAFYATSSPVRFENKKYFLLFRKNALVCLLQQNKNIPSINSIGRQILEQNLINFHASPLFLGKRGINQFFRPRSVSPRNRKTD